MTLILYLRGNRKLNLVVYYQSNGKVVNHKYYIEVIDHDSCSSVKFDLITKRFIFFEKKEE